MSSSPRLAVAFDFESRSEVFQFAKTLAGLPIVVKLGLGVLPYLGPADLKELQNAGFDLFIDVKLHDIPSQVARAVKTWSSFGARYLTIHCSGASQMMSEAAKAAADFDVTLLGVTVLSSLTNTHLNEVGWSRDRGEQVKWLAEQGIRAGIRGFVCPPREVAALKKLAANLGAENICACTPGLVVFPEEKRVDQPNVMSVQEAVMAGSDLLVVGRSILNAASPIQITRKILEQMK